MRIAHIITRLIVGGAQENTILCCQYLQQHYGDDVVLITGPGLGPEGSLVEMAEGRGVKVQLVPSLRRPIHPWRDLISYRALKRHLARFAPQVVHTHSGKAGLLGRIAASRLHVPAILHTVHGAPFHGYQNLVAREFFRRCERYAARKCHRMVSVADAMTDQLVRAGVGERKQFVTVYSGMEVEPFLDSDRHRVAKRQELGYDEDHVVVGAIARLFHLKGHHDIIEAARLAIRQCPQIRFLLVGEGVLRESLEETIQRASLGDYFRFAGLVSPESIAHWIAAMDVVVHASLREGLPRAVVQALLAAKPVISYDVDGAREVVIPAETGYLLVPHDIKAMADAIVELTADPELRRRLGETGRRRCVDVFRYQTMTEKLRDLYVEVLERHSAT